MNNTAAHGPLNDNHENQQSIGRWDFVAWTERESGFLSMSSRHRYQVGQCTSNLK